MVFLSMLLGMYFGKTFIPHKIAEPQTLAKPTKPKKIKPVDPQEQFEKSLEFPKIDPRSIDLSPLDSDEYKFDKNSQ